MTANPKTAFFKEGFHNWKKALERFNVHDKAECHKEAKIKVLSAHSNAPISEQLSTESAKIKAENRQMLLKTLSSLKVFATAGAGGQRAQRK